MKMAVHVFTRCWIFFIVVQFQATTGNVTDGVSSKERTEECPANYRETDNGLCEKCPVGSQGKNCSTKCPNNFYGEDCLKQCNCAKQHVCNESVGCIPILRDGPSSEETNTVDYSSLISTGPDIETSTISHADKDAVVEIKPLLKFLVLGFVLLLIVNLCCGLILKRCLARKRLHKIPNAETTEENAEVSTREIRTDFLFSSGNDEAGYSEIAEVQNTYSDHIDDQYHVLSFFRRTRTTYDDTNASNYDHVDIRNIKNNQLKLSEDKSLQFSNDDPAILPTSEARSEVENVNLHILSVSDNDEQSKNECQLETRPYSLALPFDDNGELPPLDKLSNVNDDNVKTDICCPYSFTFKRKNKQETNTVQAELKGVIWLNIKQSFQSKVETMYIFSLPDLNQGFKLTFVRIKKHFGRL